ncbi:hypothetical protein PanWU01x14_085630 [Parasponia andersonii]|uniref:Uncharacterized protein n=1 Tax=Parasponia andersonii TaxID=3476 RepID=A0A2P5D906_PARAD|nr:hypothetical protein PanWU01x14_085630 [Parasponia andersonii]
MDPEEIVKLYKHLNLVDHKGPTMRMSPEMYEDSKEKMKLRLVGRVFGNKFVNREGLYEVIEQVWRTTRKRTEGTKRCHQWSDYNNSPMRSSGSKEGTNNGGLDEMGATLNSDNEINRVAMVETHKRWDSSTDNTLEIFTSGEDAIDFNKGNTGGDSYIQQDTNSGKAKASRNTTVDSGELPFFYMDKLEF